MKLMGFKLSFENSIFLGQAGKSEVGILGRKSQVSNGMATVRVPGHTSLDRAKVYLEEWHKTR